MASTSNYYLLLILFSSLCLCAVSAQLSLSFYLSTCPTVLAVIKAKVIAAVANDRRMGASLLRLHFHDCFVNGCDGSVLLDDTSSLTGEKGAPPNANSLRGFEVVDSIKSAVEAVCPQAVSCADILAVAARDSVVALGGPSWPVSLGRRDSTTASLSATSDLPPPFDDLPQLISAFSKKGLSTTDMVALSGAHTIGKAKCAAFRSHIYDDANIDPTFASTRQANCPSSGGDDNLAPLDVATENIFDNFYFKNLVNLKGLLHSDQALFNNVSTDSLVQTYSSNMATFFNDFKSAMVKMGNIDVLTGSSGEIRIDCRKVN